VLTDPDSEEYAQYVANSRRAAGCEPPTNANCRKQIQLDLVDYPRQIPRSRFEKPDWEHGDVGYVSLRTTNLVLYDLWVSKYFSPDPSEKWGYDIQIRDKTGKLLGSMVVAFRDLPDCSKYVVLESGKSMDVKIPISGANLETLKGDQINLTIVYEVNPLFSPMAENGTEPILGKYVSNTVNILIS
jgi:hypothetical protein